ncbi:MAG: penicillin acylase family protein [Halioglobus sp.]
MRTTVFGTAALALALGVTAANAAKPTKLPQLKSAASITRDVDGIAHVRAGNERDMFFLQGWVHVQDRLFQADVNRRQPSGTLAELLGPEALGSDVELRTLGLRRSAELSWAAIKADAADGDPVARGAKEALEAYAEGFNAHVDALGAALPPEYGALGLTSVEPWTPVDSIVIGKLIAFGLSFDLDDIQNTMTLGAFQAVLGPQNGYLLFAEDLYRSQPFDPASTVPDSGGNGEVKPPKGNGPQGKRSATIPAVNGQAVSMGKSYLARAGKVPLLKTILENDRASRGSNNWGVTRGASSTGNPIIANDPHLALDHPTTFYPMQLSSPNYDAVGNGFAGTPFVITGQNRYIAWGPTTNPMDVTDIFLDTVVPDPGSPSGISVELPGGELGPIVPVPESYFANVGGSVVPIQDPSIPPFTLTVPARYHGVIINFDGDFQTGGSALTAQFTGFGPTRELESFYIWNSARNLSDFRRGLEKFDFGSQNWAYADKWGNLGYFTSAEMPIRTDLQVLGEPAGGVPPYFIRLGSLDLHQWLPVSNPYPGQVTPYEILSPEEMPQVVNPANGYFVNANNDPAGNTLDNDVLNEMRPGGGVFYLNPGYASGFRAGSITERVQRVLSTGDQKMSVAEMAEIQADVGLLDAEFFAPLIVAAYEAGQSAGADPLLAGAVQDSRLSEATSRLAAWADLDYQAKTGIPEGYDSEDVDGEPSGSLDADEIAASVATTIYSVWRSSFISSTIDAGLQAKGLLDYRPGSALAVSALRQLVENGGVSASGVDFFAAGSGDKATDVQVLMLQSLSDALDRLASDEYAAAFDNSAVQEDYRWGLLHRIVMDSPLGGPFSVPEAFGAFPAPLPGLRGIPTDGGFGTVDASSHGARAAGVNGFMFSSGPTNRWVSDVPRQGPYSQSVWPGGTSAVPGDAFYIYPMLPRWLTNDAKPIRFKSGDVNQGASRVEKFTP